MNHTVNIEFLNKRQAGFWIETGWSQKLLTNGLAQLVNVLITLEALYIKDNFTNQRVAIGMNTGGRQAQNNISSLYLFTGDNLGLLHSTNSKTSNIIFTLSIEASHLSCLTADKCTARLLAGVGYTLYYICYLLRLQLAYSQIIQEEQRLRTLYQNVINAHSNSILTNGIMLVQNKSQTQLGAYTVSTRNQYRLLVLSAHGKKAAEATQITQYLWTIGCLYAVLNQLYRQISCINIYTSISISKFLFHLIHFLLYIKTSYAVQIHICHAQQEKQSSALPDNRR